MGIKDIRMFLNRLDKPVIGRLKQSLKKKNVKVIIFVLNFKSLAIEVEHSIHF